MFPIVGRSLPTPASPSTFFVPFTPLPLTPNRHQQRLDNLSQCLVTSVPPEIVYPSFGQVCSEADKVTSFLDLYRIRALDDAQLRKVKSPTSKEVHGGWAALEEIAENNIGVAKRRGNVRRSRSLGDLKHPELFAMNSTLVEEGGSDATQGFDKASPSHDQTVASPHGTTDDAQQTHGRSRSLEDATTSVVGSDTKRIAGPRRGFGTRPPQLRLAPFPPPNIPLPSPPPLTSLRTVQSPKPVALRVAAHKVRQPRKVMPLRLSPPDSRPPLRSPQAPYWVKTTRMEVPNTPRTVRSKRRQGWGGAWYTGSIGQVAGQLKEI